MTRCITLLVQHGMAHRVYQYSGNTNKDMVIRWIGAGELERHRVAGERIVCDHPRPRQASKRRVRRRTLSEVV